MSVKIVLVDAPILKGMRTNKLNSGLKPLLQLLLSHHQTQWKCHINSKSSLTTHNDNTIPHWPLLELHLPLYPCICISCFGQTSFSSKAFKTMNHFPHNPIPTLNLTTSNSHTGTTISHKQPHNGKYINTPHSLVLSPLESGKFSHLLS